VTDFIEEREIACHIVIERDYDPGASADVLRERALKRARTMRFASQSYGAGDAQLEIEHMRARYIAEAEANEQRSATAAANERMERALERELAAAKHELDAATEDSTRDHIRSLCAARASRSLSADAVDPRAAALRSVRTQRPWLFPGQTSAPKRAPKAKQRGRTQPKPLEPAQALRVAKNVLGGAMLRAVERSPTINARSANDLGALVTAAQIEEALDAELASRGRAIPVRTHGFNGNELPKPIKLTERVASMVASLRAELRAETLAVFLAPLLGDGSAEYREVSALHSATLHARDSLLASRARSRT
jgi:hypothetical protein